MSTFYISDFLYLRKAEIVESPYFSKFAKLKQDLDKVYTDIISHDAITNFKKYSKIIYEFLKEKYFSMVPFGKFHNYDDIIFFDT